MQVVDIHIEMYRTGTSTMSGIAGSLRTVRGKCVKEICSRSFASTAGSVRLAKFDLKGIFPPIPTPFNGDESIAWNKLKDNITKWNGTKIRGYLVQGSNGEYCYLSKEERIEMIRKVREFSSSDKLVLAGAGCESTAHTIEMTQAMASCGADAVLIITPNYFKAKMSDEVLYRHFTAVADASPVPVVLYNVPANTNVDMTWQTVARLSDHPNIVGVKESNGDVTKIGRMVHETRKKKESFQVLAGSAGFLLGSLHVGAVGAISALANVLPDEVCRLQELFERGGNGEAAAELQRRLTVPNSAVTQRFGVPGLKQAMEWYGYYGGPTRRPLLPLEDKETKLLREDFTSSGFL